MNTYETVTCTNWEIPFFLKVYPIVNDIRILLKMIDICYGNRIGILQKAYFFMIVILDALQCVIFISHLWE